MSTSAVAVPLAGKDYMTLFYEEIQRIAAYVRDEQVGNIVEAMTKAYEAQAEGRQVFSHVLVGHFAMFAASPRIPGQPNVLPQRADRDISADYNRMKPGDFLLTNGCSLINPDKGTIPEVGPNEARARGAYTVGITCSYVRFYKTPLGAFLPVKMSTSLEEICDLLIDSGCTWSCGVISTPAIPEFKIVSSSGLSQFLVYWACTAALCRQIATKGKEDGTKDAKMYLDAAIESFSKIHDNEYQRIDEVARDWTDRILLYADDPDPAAKPRLLVYGHAQGGTPYEGTQNMFVNEAYETASGTMIAQPYEMYKTQLKANDIVLIGAISPDNADEIEVAKYVRQIGAMTVAFGPFDGGGVLAIDGFSEKVCPTSGLAGNLALWLLTAQWTYHMAQRNQTPYYWQNYWEVGASDYDNAAHAKFLERGY